MFFFLNFFLNANSNKKNVKQHVKALGQPSAGANREGGRAGRGPERAEGCMRSIGDSQVGGGLRPMGRASWVGVGRGPAVADG